MPAERESKTGTAVVRANSAFVISPIGAPDSAERRHADWVLKSIIQPACDLAGGLRADRGEQITKQGQIMDQVLDSLIDDRLVIAVLAFERPNVYYELALAMAAGRHVVILRHSKEKRHFDIAGFRTVNYADDLEGQALTEKVAELAEHLRTALAQDSHKPTVFSRNLDPLGRLYREYEFKDTFKEIDTPDYLEVFRKASKFIGLQGISLFHFTKSSFTWNAHDHSTWTFFQVVEGKILFDAVDVIVVLMDENNSALPHLLKFNNRGDFTRSLKEVKAEIRQSFEAWSDLEAELEGRRSQRADGRKGSLKIHRLAHGVVNYRLTLTEQQAILTPYMNIFPYNSRPPALICREGTTFYDRLYREFIDRAVSNEMATAALNEHGSLVMNQK